MVVEEELDTSPPGRLPRWLLPVSGLVAVAVLVAVALAIGSNRSTPKPTPTSTPPVLAVGDSVDALTTDSEEGVFLQVRGGRLGIRSVTGEVTRMTGPLQVTAHASDRIGLAVDSAARTVWVYAADDNSPGHAAEYSIDDLRELDRIALPAHVEHAAALDDTLYVTSAGALMRHDGRDNGFTAINVGSVLDLVADPTRHRVAYVGVGPGGFTLGAVTGTTALTPVRTASGFPPSIAVVDGVIWAAGDIKGRSWLATLEPRTLAPGANRADPGSTDGLDIVSTGDGSLFVRDRGDTKPLTCLDARTGARTMRWPDADGVVAATRGRVVLAPTIGSSRSLALGGCPA